jgi:DNA-directed RNA polymerase subunit beta
LKEEYKIFEEAARERIVRLLKGQESNGGGSTKRGDKLSEDVLSGLEF